MQYEGNKHLLSIVPMNDEESLQIDQLSRSLDRLDNALTLVDHTLLTLHGFSPKNHF